VLGGRFPAQAAGQAQPVERGHETIGKNHIGTGRGLAQQRIGLRAILGDLHLVTKIAKHGRHHHRRHAVILDQQNTHPWPPAGAAPGAAGCATGGTDGCGAT
jgi:hypothetical protein